VSAEVMAGAPLTCFVGPNSEPQRQRRCARTSNVMNAELRASPIADQRRTGCRGPVIGEPFDAEDR